MKRGKPPLSGSGKWFGVDTIVLEPGAENIDLMNLRVDKDAALIKVSDKWAMKYSTS